MKVYIGPYKKWWGPYQFAELLKYVGIPEHVRIGLADKLPMKPFDWFENLWFRERKIDVRLDPWDTWSADHTLACIIRPLLIELRVDKNGVPLVDDEDVPEHLRERIERPEDGYWDEIIDPLRWDYVIGEMIFAFTNIENDDWEEQFYSGEIDFKFEPLDPDDPDSLFEMKTGPDHTYEVDWEGRDAFQKRINNGLRLFGKYYQSLWS